MRLLQDAEDKTTKNNTPVASERQTKETKPTKRKRQYPYRKVADLEAEIAVEENRVKELERTLASPELYREGAKVLEITQAFEDAKLKLKQLYDHWEESVELNG
jgi:ATP-binding cassette subfamily F protein 3